MQSQVWEVREAAGKAMWRAKNQRKADEDLGTEAPYFIEDHMLSVRAELIIIAIITNIS